MALDKQSIEKKDFPVGRRGYDPEAVDAHLAALAQEVADFKRSARRRSDTLASAASEHVQAIVQAAETSAADIQRDAESEAREIREEANSEAQTTREQAAVEARDYVGKVSESTTGMLTRIDSMESELAALTDSLRTGAKRLNADLSLLEGALSEVSAVVAPRPRFEPEAEPGPEPVAAPEHEDRPETELASGDRVGHEAQTTNDQALEAPGAESTPDGSPGHDADAPDDIEGARLIALNMALNGTPRNETAKYLSENFQLGDRDRLLDEVYASVSG